MLVQMLVDIVVTEIENHKGSSLIETIELIIIIVSLQISIILQFVVG